LLISRHLREERGAVEGAVAEQRASRQLGPGFRERTSVLDSGLRGEAELVV